MEVNNEHQTYKYLQILTYSYSKRVHLEFLHCVVSKFFGQSLLELIEETTSSHIWVTRVCSVPLKVITDVISIMKS